MKFILPVLGREIPILGLISNRWLPVCSQLLSMPNVYLQIAMYAGVVCPAITLSGQLLSLLYMHHVRSRLCKCDGFSASVYLF